MPSVDVPKPAYSIFTRSLFDDLIPDHSHTSNLSSTHIHSPNTSDTIPYQSPQYSLHSSHDLNTSSPSQSDKSYLFASYTSQNSHVCSHDTSQNIPQINPNPPLRKYTRIHKPHEYLQAYHCNLIHNTIHIASQSDSSSSDETCKCHLSSSLSYQHLSSAHKHFALSLSSISEPSNYNDAMCDENWKNTVKVELEAFNRNKTWELTYLSAHKKEVGCKWVFKLKLDANGTVERYKARLIAKGFTQTEGISTSQN